MSAFRALEAVFFLRGIEMTAGGSETRPFAFSDRMNMNRVKSRREPFYLQLDQDSSRFVTQRRGSDDLPVFVLQFCRSSRWFGAARQISEPDQSCKYNHPKPVVHRASIFFYNSSLITRGSLVFKS